MTVRSLLRCAALVAKLEPVTVEVTFMTKAGRKKQTMKNVKPADYYAKSLLILEK